MKSISPKWYSIITGTVFLFLILIIFILIPCPTNPQLNFFRIFIALSAAAFAATLPGTIKVNNKLVAATSSIGVFVLLYLLNPAGWNSNNDCNLKNFKTIVYIDNKLTQGVEITIPAIGRKFTTNEFGSANIEYATEQMTLPTSFVFKYKNTVDTIIIIKKIQNILDFYFQSAKIGTTEINNNSINYNLNDININISLINQNNPLTQEELDLDDLKMEHDCLTYSFKNIGDTIFIEPNSTILNQYNNNLITDGFELSQDGDGISRIINWAMNLPKFDFKITNNSSDAIFLNQLVLTVNRSFPNNDARLITGNSKSFSLYNYGWGDAKNVILNFSSTPLTKEPNWQIPSEEQVEFPILKSGSTSSALKYVITNLTKKGVNPKCFADDNSAVYYNPENPKERAKGKKEAGEFIDGAIIYGTITYSDENHSSKIQKFKTHIEVMRYNGGYALEPFSADYNTELKTIGDEYSINVPASNTIKPKDFDRISLTLASKKSSSHYFKLSFYYNDKILVLPYIFKLNYFITYDESPNLIVQKV